MMKHEYWIGKWSAGDIGFHEGMVNPLLERNVEKLVVAEGKRVFLPLCGKTRDIRYLRARGCAVLGAELSEIAVKELFSHLDLTPEVRELDGLTRYRAEGVDVFLGDVFLLTRETLGPVDAIYDRAAMVALPPEIRASYAAHLLSVSDAAPQLLLTCGYDEGFAQGPPFSIKDEEVREHYASAYTLKKLGKRNLPNVFGGRIEVTETAWLLS